MTEKQFKASVIHSVFVILAGAFCIVCHLWLGFLSFVFFRGIYYVAPDFYLLSETLLAVLIAKGSAG